jgi:hypothetical protein
MKLYLFILFLVVFVQSQAQNSSIMGQKDTLKHEHTTGGTIDSIDIAFSFHSSTLPGGGFSRRENTQSYDLFLKNEGGSMFRHFNPWKKKRFSALPHLGFGYIFGGQATQIVKATYTHAFDYKNILNVDYDMQKGNSFLRSGDFTHHDVQLQFEHQSNFYSFEVRGQYLNRDIGQNGGILTDTLIESSGLAFAPVRKSNARSKYRGVRIELDHYFDFLMKDSLNSTGLYIDNKMYIFNRKYQEISDTLSLIYANNFIDNDSTNDQYQLSEIVNSAGLYYDRKGFYLKAGLQNNWWNYFNLGSHISRSEINLDGKLGITIRKINLQNHTNFNFIGAKGEWFSNTKLQFGWKNFDFHANADFSHLLPEPFQRSYFGNHLNYALTFDQLKKQFRINLNARLNYSIKQHSVGIFAKNATLTNNYWFYNDTWTTDTIGTLNSLSIGISGKTGYKILKFDVSGSYNNSNWMPDLLVQGRLYLQGKMFKGRKLLAQIGVETSYHSGYNLIEMIPLMDIYRLSAFSAEPMVNLHVFGGFEIHRFRFFFRVENMGYFWTESTNRIAIDRLIPAMQIRVGVTWDFFN